MLGGQKCVFDNGGIGQKWFGVDLYSESDTRISKPSDNIDNAYITRLGYEYDGCRWVEKAARAPTMVDVEINEEVEMDIPPL